jgi:hypothetical protein
LVLLCVLLAAGAGCHTPAPRSGFLASKIYRPAWTEMRSKFDSDGNWQGMETIHHPEQYHFVIQPESGDHKGEFLVKTTEARWKKQQVGQLWDERPTMEDLER